MKVNKFYSGNQTCYYFFFRHYLIHFDFQPLFISILDLTSVSRFGLACLNENINSSPLESRLWKEDEKKVGRRRRRRRGGGGEGEEEEDGKKKEHSVKPQSVNMTAEKRWFDSVKERIVTQFVRRVSFPDAEGGLDRSRLRWSENFSRKLRSWWSQAGSTRPLALGYTMNHRRRRITSCRLKS